MVTCYKRVLPTVIWVTFSSLKPKIRGGLSWPALYTTIVGGMGGGTNITGQVLDRNSCVSQLSCTAPLSHVCTDRLRDDRRIGVTPSGVRQWSCTVCLLRDPSDSATTLLSIYIHSETQLQEMDV
jgi:hypothetical protein